MAGKLAATALALILLIPVLIAAGVQGAISAIFGANGGAMHCVPGDSTSASVAGYGPDQLANAAIIIAVGKQLDVGQRGWVIAIAAAMQESGLRNLDHGDRDSLGLFQQRSSQGWGTPAQIQDPVYASTQFYRHLLAVPGWQNMTLNDAAQTVQRSGAPNAYGQHEDRARTIVAAVGEATCTSPAPLQNTTWTAPVAGRCTSGFGPRGGQIHRGQDIAAPIGTPILAASSGHVIDSGPASGYGLWVRIEHPSGVITTYGHNTRNLVTTGQAVHTGATHRRSRQPR